MKVLKNICLALVCLIILVMVSATVVEKYRGGDFVREYVYGSIPFVGLWGVLAVCSTLYILSRRLYRRLSAFMIHISFLLILAGALVTHCFGRQGTLHLRLDEAAASQLVIDEGREETLPFNVSLTDFKIEYYAGTHAPMDFVSRIKIDGIDGETCGIVSMNRIFKYDNYRFYQSFYDEDGKGVTLSVSYDPYGIGVTYAGYAMLFVSMLSFLFFRRCGGRVRRAAAFSILMVISAFGYGQELKASPKVLPVEVAEKFGELYVYHNDRVCPFATLAKEFTVKIYGKSSYEGFTPEQVLTGWMFYYSDWKKEPVIKIKDRRAARLLGIKGKYACLDDFMSEINEYKLEKSLRESSDVERKGLREADEKFNIVIMACNGSLVKLFPYTEHNETRWFSQVDELPSDMPHGQWLFVRRSMNYVNELIAGKDFGGAVSVLDKLRDYQIKEAGRNLPDGFRFKAEMLYNRMEQTKTVGIVFVVAGLLCFALMIRSVVEQRDMTAAVRILFGILVLSGALYLTLQMVLRWCVSGHVPLSNGFETMQFMAWSVFVITLLLQRRSPMLLPFGIIIGGLSLLVSMFGESNPQITPLMPVLSSPLLSIHVVLVMVAYSLFAFMLMNGVAALTLRFMSRGRYDRQIEGLRQMSMQMLYPALFCLTGGIFIGAVWANVSWGRYWGWDPKEVWALITMMIYAFPLHAETFPRFRKAMFFHTFSILAFLSVLVTYFGVNFLLAGMHSYAV